MQVVCLICFLGAGSAMALWAAFAVPAAADEITRRGGQPFPPAAP
jgi:hypothetical protein